MDYINMDLDSIKEKSAIHEKEYRVGKDSFGIITSGMSESVMSMSEAELKAIKEMGYIRQIIEVLPPPLLQSFKPSCREEAKNMIDENADSLYHITKSITKLLSIEISIEKAKNIIEDIIIIMRSTTGNSHDFFYDFLHYISDLLSTAGSIEEAKNMIDELFSGIERRYEAISLRDKVVLPFSADACGINPVEAIMTLQSLQASTHLQSFEPACSEYSSIKEIVAEIIEDFVALEASASRRTVSINIEKEEPDGKLVTFGLGTLSSLVSMVIWTILTKGKREKREANNSPLTYDTKRGQPMNLRKRLNNS